MALVTMSTVGRLELPCGASERDLGSVLGGALTVERERVAVNRQRVRSVVEDHGRDVLSARYGVRDRAVRIQVAVFGAMPRLGEAPMRTTAMASIGTASFRTCPPFLATGVNRSESDPKAALGQVESATGVTP
jgi:hypothetical protein